MYYYLVWVRTNRYHSKELLTYASDKDLPAGSIVKVELQNIPVLGFIVSKTSKPSFKTKAIDFVYTLPVLPKATIELAKWIIDYYPSPLGVAAQQFLPRVIPVKAEQSGYKIGSPKPDSLPPLNEDQQQAVKTISASGTYLLHGKTGSGKTRVYIELALKTIAEGRSVIVLSPEIGLSSQLNDNFKEVFKDRVVTVHSRQTPSERITSWLKCLTSKDPLIVIGPRSALFSPLNNIGLIIIDEAHDGAYKQEQLPHYQAVRVASALSSLSGAKLVLGSATPSVNDYYLAKEKSRPIIELNKLAKGPSAKSKVTIVDLKDRDNFSTSAVLSDPLIESIKKSLESSEQSLIFLNRRGTSRLILCENCGWEALCPNCNLPLIYHGDLHNLRCHTCGYVDKEVPTICPNCGRDSIMFTTVGTKAVVDEIRKLFTNAKLGRFDTDNPKAESIGELYKTVQSGEIDILIGTQQLAKGFDLPKLSTVGILQADTNLYLPDYTSEERSFQLITQVLGRISRGHIEGRAVIQTYNPDSTLLKAAISQDYKSFYKKEIAERSKFKFPPFYNLLKISCRRATPKSAEAACLKLKQSIEQKLRLKVDGPAPSFHERQQGKYEWQLVVKSTSRSALLEAIKLIPTGWTYDIDPSNLL